MVTFSPSDPLGDDVRTEIGHLIADFVAARRRQCLDISPTLEPLVDQASALTEGGKRMRPAMCYWGAVAVGGQPTPEGTLAAAASLDLLHVSALVHDDVMDASDTRRGRPAAHRRFEQQHVAAGWLGSPAAHGRAAAILLGDLLLMWSAELFAGSGLDPETLARAQPVLDAVRTEVTAGQYLDVLAQTQPLGDPRALLETVYRVVEFKTARYTVIRPVQLGATIAGATPGQLAALADYGSALGRAFQFRDDLLGVFGDSELTGKPAGDDLREGKRTVLVASALAQASPEDAATVAALLGRPDLSPGQIDHLREILITSGAVEASEAEIQQAHDAAIAALDGADFTAEGRLALTTLADLAVRREF